MNVLLDQYHRPDNTSLVTLWVSGIEHDDSLVVLEEIAATVARHRNGQVFGQGGRSA